jgi:hypothetical protein
MNPNLLNYYACNSFSLKKTLIAGFLQLTIRENNAGCEMFSDKK